MNVRSVLHLIRAFLLQLAIIENLRNLKELLDQRLASVSDDVYFEILRDTLQHVCQYLMNISNVSIPLLLSSNQRQFTALASDGRSADGTDGLSTGCF